MGRVYKARDRSSTRSSPSRRFAARPRPDAVQRFKQELVLARKITHKNVVRIFDLGEAEGHQVLHAWSTSRARASRPSSDARNGSPPTRRSRSRGRSWAPRGSPRAGGRPPRPEAAEHHGGPGAASPTSWTSASPAPPKSPGMTATGAIIGTPDYMSPEQVKGEKAGPPSDIFSFGVILYEMLTGDLPYQADTAASRILMRLTAQAARPPRAHARTCRSTWRASSSSAWRWTPPCATRAPRPRPTSTPARGPGPPGPDRPARSKRTAALRSALVAGGGRGPGGAVAPAWWTPPPAPAAAAPRARCTPWPSSPSRTPPGSAELEWMRTGLPEMLVTDLSQSSYVRPVPGERVLRLLQEAGLASQTRFDEAALESVSKRAHAEKVLSGQFVESGGRLRLDLTLRRRAPGCRCPSRWRAPPPTSSALVDQIIAPDQGRARPEPGPAPGRQRPAGGGSVDGLAPRPPRLPVGPGRAAAGRQPGGDPTAQGGRPRPTRTSPWPYAKLAEACLHAGDHERGGAGARTRASPSRRRAPFPWPSATRSTRARPGCKEDYETAAKSYAELQKLYPDDPDVQLNLAQASGRWGKLPGGARRLPGGPKMPPVTVPPSSASDAVQVMSGSPDEAMRVAPGRSQDAAVQGRR